MLLINILLLFLYEVDSYESMSRIYETLTSLRKFSSLIILPASITCNASLNSIINNYLCRCRFHNKRSLVQIGQRTNGLPCSSHGEPQQLIVMHHYFNSRSKIMGIVKRACDLIFFFLFVFFKCACCMFVFVFLLLVKKEEVVAAPMQERRNEQEKGKEMEKGER